MPARQLRARYVDSHYFRYYAAMRLLTFAFLSKAPRCARSRRRRRLIFAARALQVNYVMRRYAPGSADVYRQMLMIVMKRASDGASCRYDIIAYRHIPARRLLTLAQISPPRLDVRH